MEENLPPPGINEDHKLPLQPPQPPKRKRVYLGIGAALLLIVLALSYFLLSKKASAPAGSTENQTTKSAQTPTEDINTITMLATGDFIAHDAINARAKTETGYDYSGMMTAMKPYFTASDINFCNQATLAGGSEFGITGYPVFNGPFEWIRDMRGLGCNLINTGTNHTNDKGQGAISAQLKEWDKQPDMLAVAGANRSSEEQAKVRYFSVKGVKFAFLSYTTYVNLANPNPYSLNRYNDELVVPQMTEARLQADVVIVSMRWGTEYSDEINNAQEQQAQHLADLGADIVLGHGTHTLQPVKRLTGTLPDDSTHETVVWFGLGNFLNAQLETAGLTGCVAQFVIDVPSKTVKDSSCLPFYQHYEWTAEQKAAEDLLARQNFKIMPLFDAKDFLAKSQLNTTVEEQTERIQTLVNTYTKIPILDGTANL